MFFGLPNQLYFARSPRAAEAFKDAKLREETNKLAKKYQNNTAIDHRLFTSGDPVESKFASRMAASSRKGDENRAKNLASNVIRERRLEEAKKSGFVKPFRGYHLITSGQHIVANNIRATSRDVANTVVIKYPKESLSADDIIKGEAAVKTQEETFTLKIDSALPTEETRTQMGQFVNVTNPELARRYALSLLCRNIKDVYKGDICILGNPRIKPYDVCYLFDEYTDMLGPIEVEQVVHVFDQKHGFRTEIRPDMLVQASEWSLLGAAEALGIVIEGAVKKWFGGSTASDSGGTGQQLSIGPWLAGYGLNLVGGFLAQKIVNYTQLGQPLVMSPLQHHGRPFAGGIPLRKMPHSLWDTTFGTWNAEIEKGWDAWKEDFKDEVSGWISTAKFDNTTGNFFDNGGDPVI
jgi:hypothetical protein